MPNDYESNPSPRGSACSYSNLCSYVDSFQIGGAIPPVVSRSNAISLVPSWGSYGYKNPQNPNRPQWKMTDQGSCNGYFPINRAYPAYPACSQFTSRICND